MTVCDGVHLNPVRAKWLKPEQRLRAYRWSSWPEYVKPPDKRWPLAAARSAAEPVGRRSRQRRRALAVGAGDETTEAAGMEPGDFGLETIAARLLLGARDFRKRMLELIGQPQGRQPHGEQLRQSEAQKAQRLVGAMLRAAGWTEMDLRHRRKGDKGKVGMAVGLRAETTISWAWLGNRLGMGPWRPAANTVRASLKQCTHH